MGIDGHFALSTSIQCWWDFCAVTQSPLPPAHFSTGTWVFWGALGVPAPPRAQHQVDVALPAHRTPVDDLCRAHTEWQEYGAAQLPPRNMEAPRITWAGAVPVPWGLRWPVCSPPAHEQNYHGTCPACSHTCTGKRAEFGHISAGAALSR